jgi:hypothetical protein
VLGITDEWHAGTRSQSEAGSPAFAGPPESLSVPCFAPVFLIAADPLRVGTGSRLGEAVRLRAPGERANAQLKTWGILRKLRCCPWRAGQLAKAIHTLEIHTS